MATEADEPTDAERGAGPWSAALRAALVAAAERRRQEEPCERMRRRGVRAARPR